jgi:hypothetical protein
MIDCAFTATVVGANPELRTSAAGNPWARVCWSYASASRASMRTENAETPMDDQHPFPQPDAAAERPVFTLEEFLV